MVILGNGVAGAWALAAHRWPRLRTRALWWFVAFAQVAMFVQVIVGVILVSREHRTVAKFHMFYGFVAIIAIGIIYSYGKQMGSRRYLIYGFGGLFVMGLGIRALLVGRA
jgi:Co/Zn/Cd efflux system component